MPMAPAMTTFLRPRRSDSIPAGMFVKKRPTLEMASAKPTTMAEPPIRSTKRGNAGMVIIIAAWAVATRPPTTMMSSGRSGSGPAGRGMPGRT